MVVPVSRQSLGGCVFRMLFSGCASNLSVSSLALTAAAGLQHSDAPLAALGSCAVHQLLSFPLRSPGGITFEGKVQLLAFCGFEVLVGIFWPSMMTMRRWAGICLL